MSSTTRSAWLAVVLLVAMASSAFAGGTIEGKVNYKSPRWIRDTVVYLEQVDGDFEPEDAVMDQKGSTFVPKFLPVITGSTVKFTNSDPTDHNVYTPDGESYDLGTAAAGGTLTRTFDKPGVYTQLCKLHPTMIAYVIVLDNPFYAISDKEGRFKIEDVPAGHYTLATWNERYKADAIEVDVKNGAAAEVTIELHR